MRSACVTLSMAIVLAAGAQSARGIDHYVITDLSSDFMPSGINDEGQVVGNSVPSTKPGSIVGWGAVLCSGGVTTVLPGLAAGNYTSAYAINDSGQVVGGSGPDVWNPQAFLYANGTTASLGTLGGTASLALGINGSGQIVGSALTTANATVRAFLYSNGTMTDIGTAGGSNASCAVGISDSGQIAGMAFEVSSFSTEGPAVVGPGTATGKFFFYSNGATSVPSISPLSEFCPLAVSRDGRVVGAGLRPLGIDPTFYSGPLAYENGASASLGTWTYADLFPNADTAYGVNSSGEVVGSTVSTVSATAAYPFVYANGTTADLNSLIATSSGWTLQYASAINDRGWIAGQGINPTRQWTAYILRPALPGDANLNGRVDVNDLTIVLTNFGTTAASWATGDFIGDGTVDINDLTIVLSNFGQSLSPLAAAPVAVPEPATLVLVAAAVVVFGLRRYSGA